MRMMSRVVRAQMERQEAAANAEHMDAAAVQAPGVAMAAG
jgi:hypothetical protein